MYLDKKQLTAFLKVGSKVVVGSKLSILSHYLLEFDQEGLNITGTNLKCTVTKKLLYTNTVADVARPFSTSIVVAREVLTEIVKLCGKSIFVTKDEGYVFFDGFEVISSDHKVEEFPELGFIPKDGIITGHLNHVPDLLQVSTFQSNDDTRYFMCGVCFEMEENKVKCIATDGRRLGTDLEAGTVDYDNKLLSVIIPYTGLLKFTKDKEIDFQYSAVTKQFMFEAVEFNLLITPVDGQFPNWRRIVPDIGQCQYTVDIPGESMRELLQKIRIDHLVRGVKVNKHLVTISFGEDNIQAGPLDDRIEFQYNFPKVQHKVVNYEFLKDIFTDDNMYTWSETDNPEQAVLITKRNMMFVFMGMRL